KEDLETAIRYLKKALEIDHNFDRAHYNLGLVYLAQEKKEDAAKEFKETFKLSPSTIWGQLAKQHLEGLK
ncbi:MAG: tetratricopeptide repeat protein, partial [bacterium]|nr:tetratricopeptide repeat protein [bacterium]